MYSFKHTSSKQTRKVHVSGGPTPAEAIAQKTHLRQAWSWVQGSSCNVRVYSKLGLRVCVLIEEEADFAFGDGPVLVRVSWLARALEVDFVGA